MAEGVTLLEEMIRQCTCPFDRGKGMPHFSVAIPSDATLDHREYTRVCCSSQECPAYKEEYECKQYCTFLEAVDRLSAAAEAI